MKKETGRSTKETLRRQLRITKLDRKGISPSETNQMSRTLFGKCIFDKTGYNIWREWTKTGGETWDARGNDGRTNCTLRVREQALRLSLQSS